MSEYVTKLDPVRIKESLGQLQAITGRHDLTRIVREYIETLEAELNAALYELAHEREMKTPLITKLWQWVNRPHGGM